MVAGASVGGTVGASVGASVGATSGAAGAGFVPPNSACFSSLVIGIGCDGAAVVAGAIAGSVAGIVPSGAVVAAAGVAVSTVRVFERMLSPIAMSR